MSIKEIAQELAANIEMDHDPAIDRSLQIAEGITELCHKLGGTMRADEMPVGCAAVYLAALSLAGRQQK